MKDHGFEPYNRTWHKYDKCPRCGVEAGDICWDLRFPGKVPWRRTLKPHPERPRLDGITKPRTRAECPVCHRSIGLTRAGNFYPHADGNGPTTFDGRRLISHDCPASGKPPHDTM